MIFFQQCKIEQSCKDVCKAQEEFLMCQLKANKCTEYGRLFGFSDMRNSCDFRRCHPLVNYDHYKPYITRMKNGECNILTKDDPVMFATTAGTSGERKCIPITPSQE